MDGSLKYSWVVLAFVLFAASCPEPYAPCQNSSECPTHQLCVGNHCHDRCQQSDQCKSQESCVAGACVVVGGACSSNLDCAPSLRCSQGTCLVICIRDRDCADKQVCSNGLCLGDHLDASAHFDQGDFDRTSGDHTRLDLTPSDLRRDVLPDLTEPDTGGPDVNPPDVSGPEINTAQDISSSDRGVSDIGVVDIGVDTGIPDAAVMDTGIADAVVADSVSDVGPADLPADAADSSVPDGRQPDRYTCTPVNGGWSSWGTWSAWSNVGGCNSCQQRQTRSRSRSCNNPTPSCGGAFCSGSSLESEERAADCGLVNGGWSGWSGWSTCSHQCLGTQTRTRSCNNPVPACGGAACSGSGTEEQGCNPVSVCGSGNWTCAANACSCPAPNLNCSGNCRSGTVYYADNDDDTWGGPQSQTLCAPSGIYKVTRNGDCDNSDGTMYPGAPELCDGKDNECDFDPSNDGEDECTGGTPHCYNGNCLCLSGLICNNVCTINQECCELSDCDPGEFCNGGGFCESI